LCPKVAGKLPISLQDVLGTFLIVSFLRDDIEDSLVSRKFYMSHESRVSDLSMDVTKERLSLLAWDLDLPLVPYLHSITKICIRRPLGVK